MLPISEGLNYILAISHTGYVLGNTIPKQPIA
jgi:hypothetical protein